MFMNASKPRNFAQDVKKPLALMIWLAILILMVTNMVMFVLAVSFISKTLTKELIMYLCETCLEVMRDNLEKLQHRKKYIRHLIIEVDKQQKEFEFMEEENEVNS